MQPTNVHYASLKLITTKLYTNLATRQSSESNCALNQIHYLENPLIQINPRPNILREHLLNLKQLLVGRIKLGHITHLSRRKGTLLSHESYKTRLVFKQNYMNCGNTHTRMEITNSRTTPPSKPLKKGDNVIRRITTQDILFLIKI